MTQRWTIKNKKDDFAAIVAEQGISEVTARLLVNRNLDTKAKRDVFLHPSLESGLNPALHLLFADKAAALLEEDIRAGKSIRIIGDYDVDGIVSVYILYKTMKKAGAVVDYRIPDRIKDGYGINGQMVEEAIAAGIHTIVTCDNGIAAVEPLKLAKAAGIRVVLTDHHDIPTEETESGRVQILPEADCIVNPKQVGETTPYPGICGAVVAYKVMLCLAERLDIPADFMQSFIPYAAMATICDVMDLTGENRVIAALGLKGIKTCTDVGLSALMDENHLDRENIGAYHVGFVLGPCLNASGRLDTAQKGLALLLEENQETAKQLAAEVTELNQKRKDMTAKNLACAIQLVEQQERIDRVLVLYLPECHESLAGIVAGRVREKYYRPTIILTDAEDGVKGSGRSIEAYSMFEAISECKELLTKFGGHPMAAGMTLPRENVDAFRQKLNERCALTEEDLCEKVSIDAVLPFGLVNETVISELKLLEPFGKGNAKPLFAERGVHVLRAAVLGKNANVLRLQLMNAYGRQFEAVYFGDIADWEAEVTAAFGEEQKNRMYQGRENHVCFSMIYYPERKEYRGEVSLQAVMQYCKMVT